jgi:hypothetical protein
MKAFVNRYVEGCELCQRTKPRRTQPYGLLQPLPVPAGPWQDIAYDFIPDLPPSKSFNSILTVIDRATKMAHFIPTTTKVTASGTADLFIKNVWKLHGLPRTTVSDRGTTFNSQFLKALYKQLGIQPTFSTAYHPQTDGQSERANQDIEQFLRLFVNHRMDDWIDWLPLAEFAFNNRLNETIGSSPFYANYGFNPTFTTVPSASQSNPSSEERIAEISRIQEEIKASMEVAQESQKRAYDRGVREQPKYQEGDRVWLEATNISTNRPTRKFDHKRLGPFVIDKKISDSAYRLRLPNDMRIHPVFHVNLLSPLRVDSIPGRVQAPPPRITTQPGEEFKIRHVSNSRWLQDRLQYYVRWQGRPAEDDSWTDIEELELWPGNAEKVRTYHAANPLAWSPTHRPPPRSARPRPA